MGICDVINLPLRPRQKSGSCFLTKLISEKNCFLCQSALFKRFSRTQLRIFAMQIVVVSFWEDVPRPRHNGKVSRHSRSWRELLPKVQKEAKPPEDRRELLWLDRIHVRPSLVGGGMLWGSRVANDDVVFLEHVIRFVWWICCLKWNENQALKFFGYACLLCWSFVNMGWKPSTRFTKSFGPNLEGTSVGWRQCLRLTFF